MAGIPAQDRANREDSRLHRLWPGLTPLVLSILIPLVALFVCSMLGASISTGVSSLVNRPQLPAPTAMQAVSPSAAEQCTTTTTEIPSPDRPHVALVRQSVCPARVEVHLGGALLARFTPPAAMRGAPLDNGLSVEWTGGRELTLTYHAVGTSNGSSSDPLPGALALDQQGPTRWGDIRIEYRNMHGPRPRGYPARVDPAPQPMVPPR
jgi:hypothetical protein